NIDDGPFLAKQAAAKGLVDELIYEDQMFGKLQTRLKSSDLKKVSHRDYVKVPASSLNLEGGSKLAFLVGQGNITRGDASDDGMGEEGITAVGCNKVLRRVAKDTARRARCGRTQW